MDRLPDNAAVQQIAKRVLADIAPMIRPESTEHSIAATAVALLQQHGIHSTWYHDCPALVLLGARSCHSVSGREYQPGHECVGVTNLVTVDLSPLQDNHPGDCARSFFIENGRVTDSPACPEFVTGQRLMRALHSALPSMIRPETRFCDLFHIANERILSAGFENLDFLNNVGHSLVADPKDRLFVDAQTQQRLDSVPCFTFEPHIRQRGGIWGYKHEDVYYFDSAGNIQVL